MDNQFNSAYEGVNPEARYILPSFEERTNYGSRTQDPYSRLFRDRIIFLSAPVDGTSASDLVAQLLALESQSAQEDITLYINSPGGSITDLSMVIDTINHIKPNVSTICLGLAASAAAVLLSAGTIGKRYALPNSRIMIHQPRITSAVRGQASDLEVLAQEITDTRERMEDFLVSRTKRSKEEIHRDLERDKYLSAEAALEYGIIDEIMYGAN